MLNPPKKRSSATLAFAGIQLLEPLKGIVQGDQLAMTCNPKIERLFEAEKGRRTTALRRRSPSGCVKQDTPHQLRTYREEMGAILPGNTFPVDEPQKRFMH
jgi:hypothetical protein